MEAPGKRTDAEQPSLGAASSSTTSYYVPHHDCDNEGSAGARAATRLGVPASSEQGRAEVAITEKQTLDSFSRPCKRKYEDTSLDQKPDTRRHEVETLPLSPSLSFLLPLLLVFFLPLSPPFL